MLRNKTGSNIYLDKIEMLKDPVGFPGISMINVLNKSLNQKEENLMLYTIYWLKRYFTLTQFILMTNILIFIMYFP